MMEEISQEILTISQINPLRKTLKKILFLTNIYIYISKKQL